MCGIFGYTGFRQATPLIVRGLERLEYRGYDSAGVAVLNGRRIGFKKKKGKVRELAGAISKKAIPGMTGLGHTRWATHGSPNDINAHPHLDEAESIAVVHNGIIENYLDLKSKLMKEGYTFRSETDSEVFAHLFEKHYRKTGDLSEAVRRGLREVEGAFAIGVVHRDEPGRIVVSRFDSPLILGAGDGENFVSSDIPALLEHTNQVISLENGDVAVITAQEICVWDKVGQSVQRPVKKILWSVDQAQKGGFSHFMLKEIFEQPDVVQGLVKRRLTGVDVEFEELTLAPSDFKRINNISIVACGTSYHAGMVGRYVFEQLLPYPVNVDTSSEFRYRDPKVGKNTLVIVISQSGETADTLAALREAKKKGALTLALCNVLGSSIEREADGVIYTYAGPEIAVASTKAYTAQLATLYLLAFYLARRVARAGSTQVTKLIGEFRRVPDLMREFLKEYKAGGSDWEKNVHKFNKRYHAQLEHYLKSPGAKEKRAPNGCFLFLGRNINYPSALEGALKLKEISYISAEGYPAGEMKHGPIALIDENPWVICIAVKSKTYDKMVSNIQEIKARGGLVTAIITKGDPKIKKLNLFLYIEVPPISEILSPLLVALPLQLIAFSVAKEFGEEIDQPRNLAKSVTVE